jgi:hypothetical protein
MPKNVSQLRIIALHGVSLLYLSTRVDRGIPGRLCIKKMQLSTY